MIVKLKKRLALAILIYLRTLAKIQLAKYRPIIIGITASAGKTSLMHAIQAILDKKYKVKISEKANSESGIPLNILGIKPIDFSLLDWLRIIFLAPIKLLTNWEKYEIYLVELGIDSPYPPKNMEYLLTIVKPRIGVFLNALPVHSRFFDPLVPNNITDQQKRKEMLTDLIAKEKGKLIASLPDNGTAILNLDDPRVKTWAHKTKAKVFTFSTAKQADLTCSNVEISIRGLSFTVMEGKQKQQVQLSHLLDEHYSQTLLAAIAVGRTLNISLPGCIKNLEENLTIPPGRMSIIEGVKQTTILDSSYNASPTTVISSLHLLKKVATDRKVAVLGDMRELGKLSCNQHKEIAGLAVKTADLIVTVGPMMHNCFRREAFKLGFNNSNLKSFYNPHLAARWLSENIRSRDTILVKGSQNTIFLEIVVEKLMLEKEEAEKLLCRRGKFWDKKRTELKA